MSAQIPDTMPISDLLKSTGYDCPESLQGKTFTEATSGGGGGNISLEANKEVSILANGIIEITPTKGKDGMKKVTANVNVGGSGGEGNISIEANKEVTISENGTTVINPSAGKDAMEKVTVNVNVPSSGGGSSGGGGAFRYFDGRNSGYTGMPKGFWVIGKNQTSGGAHCLVVTDSSSVTDPYVKPILSVTSDKLNIDENYREEFSEVTEAVVVAALGAQ